MSIMQWYNGRTSVLGLVVFICASILIYISIARRKMGKVFVRSIPALDAFDEAIGRATEMGKSVLYIAGGLDIDDPQTIASMNILSRVAEKIATYGTRLIMPCCRAMLMSMARETVKESLPAGSASPTTTRKTTSATSPTTSSASSRASTA